MQRRGLLLAVGLLLTTATACMAGRRPAPEPALRVLSSTLPEQLDPTRDSRLGSRHLYQNLYDPLVRIDASGKLVPVIAESWTNPSPDTYAFRLRPGLSFHDGQPLTADHVVASLERARDPASAIAGAVADVAEVRAPDARSVVVRTHGPSPVLLHALTAVPIFKPAQAGALPVGSGPYRPVEFQPGKRMLLRHFAGHQEPPPLLDQVVFERYENDEQVLAALREGRPTVVLSPPPAAVATASSDPRFQIVRQLSGSLVYLAFDLARDPTPGVRLRVNPFRDPRVRRGVRSALDLSALAAPRGGVPATQLVPPGVFGFDPSLPSPKPDLAVARALLRAAGHPAGFEAVLDVPAISRSLGEGVVQQLAGLGLRLELNALSAEDFHERIASGRSSFYVYSWVVGQESGEALKAFFHTKDPARGLGMNNRTGYSNREVDTLLEQAATTTGDEARRVLLVRTMRLLMNDVPWVPLFAAHSVRIFPRDLTFPPRIDGILVLREGVAVSVVR